MENLTRLVIRNLENYLSLGNLNLTGNYPHKIQTLNLQQIDHPLSAQGLSKLLELCGPNSLCTLSIKECNTIKGKELTVKLPNLQELRIMSCKSYFADGDVEKILQSCGSKLSKLDLRASRVHFREVDEFQDKLSGLKYLDLSGCHEIRDTALSKLLTICGCRLRILKLVDTRYITEDGISQSSLPSLEILDVSNCRRITDIGFNKVLRSCASNLRKLNLKNTWFSGEKLYGLGSILPHLEDVDITWCNSVTEPGLRQLLGICGNNSVKVRAMFLDNVSQECKAKITAEFGNVNIIF